MNSPTRKEAKSRGGTPRATPTESPMMTQYFREKAAHPDAILLFRMGDFYETFFEDAHLLARETGVALTSRNPGDKEPIPLAGFPWHSAEPHIAKLLRGGHRVAICEQVEEPGPGKKLLDRRVTEVLSPGTAVGDSLLEASANNYLLALCRQGQVWGLAAADISTGEVLLGDLSEEEARGELARLRPAEILLAEADQREIAAWISVLEISPSPFQAVLDPWRFGRSRAQKLLEEHLQVTSLEPYECDDLDAALGAAGALLEYAQTQRQSELGHVRRLRRIRPEDGLHLDEATLRSLEILEPLPGGSPEATLIHVLDRTLTAAGARRLRNALRRPLSDPAAIAKRQDTVQALLDEPVRTRLRGHLRETADVERILARVHCGRAHPRDLAALRQTLSQVPRIRELLVPLSVGSTPDALTDSGSESRSDFGSDSRSRSGWDPKPDAGSDSRLEAGFDSGADSWLGAWLPETPVELAERLQRALVDSVPATLAEGGIFRDEWDRELEELRSLSRDAKSWIARLQEEERKQTGIPSLRVGYNRVFGYYLEVTQSQLGKVPERYQRKQTLAGAERFLTPELKEFEQRVLTAEEKMARRERALFEELCAAIRAFTDRLQQMARVLAELDFLQSLAEAAARGRYVRPRVSSDLGLVIREGRHPSVELALGRDRFIANDTELDGESRQLAVLTGPNMAGKSTYLRQVGLLVILAQLGSFVPASSAEVGVADRIFTRVGAHDSLSKGQSTFLVEMIETSRILHHATRRSLVLLDEVGRGTSTYDGLAIAWAVAEALAGETTPRPRTLFATHFHELTRLARADNGVFNLHVQVKEWGDRIVFVRKVLPGGADKSYGLQVARLAGVPESVIGRAQEVLARLERGSGQPTPPGKGVPAGRTPPLRQLSLFAAPEPAFVEELRRLELDHLSPLEALALLARWQTECGEADRTPPS